MIISIDRDFDNKRNKIVKMEIVGQARVSHVTISVGLILVLTCPIVAESLQVGAAPLVERVQKEDGNFLGVHVPLFYDMSLDRKNTTGESTMNINVLGGLVKIFKDRIKGPDGTFAGPLQVSIFGTPVYDNTRNNLASSPSTANRINAEPIENNEISPSKPNHSNNQMRPSIGNSNAVPIVGDILSRIGQMLQSLQRPPIQQQQPPNGQNSALNPKVSNPNESLPVSSNLM